MWEHVWIGCLNFSTFYPLLLTYFFFLDLVMWFKCLMVKSKTIHFLDHHEKMIFSQKNEKVSNKKSSTCTIHGQIIIYSKEKRSKRTKQTGMRANFQTFGKKYMNETRVPSIKWIRQQQFATQSIPKEWSTQQEGTPFYMSGFVFMFLFHDPCKTYN